MKAQAAIIESVLSITILLSVITGLTYINYSQSRLYSQNEKIEFYNMVYDITEIVNKNGVGVIFNKSNSTILSKIPIIYRLSYLSIFGPKINFSYGKLDSCNQNYYYYCVYYNGTKDGNYKGDICFSGC